MRKIVVFIIPLLFFATVSFVKSDAIGVVRDDFKPSPPESYCSVSPSQKEINHMEIDFARRLAQREARGGTVTGGVIDVYFHVITKPDGTGSVASDVLNTQINALNAAYAPWGWSFRLVYAQTIVNDGWFNCGYGSAATAEMKNALRVGTADDLNIYTCSPGGGIAGYGTFPSSYRTSPTQDGIVIVHTGLPGGTTYSQGGLAIHEVGHWMGLYHTFQGGCARNANNGGDLISDTPAEATSNYYCTPRDSCTGPNFAGLDPIENHMDYTQEACRVRFTSQQDKRMDAQYTAYRHGN